jgi:arginine exporter protein ArgO
MQQRTYFGGVMVAYVLGLGVAFAVRCSALRLAVLLSCLILRVTDTHVMLATVHGRDSWFHHSMSACRIISFLLWLSPGLQRSLPSWVPRARTCPWCRQTPSPTWGSLRCCIWCP